MTKVVQLNFLHVKLKSKNNKMAKNVAKRHSGL